LRKKIYKVHEKQKGNEEENLGLHPAQTKW